jgi:type VI secretion system protein ImpJ
VFPDGTPFRIPDDDPAPAALELDSQVRDQTVYLAVPLRRGDGPEVDRSGGDALVRRAVEEREVRNVASTSAEPAVLEVGGLRTRFLLANEAAGAYACVPMAHVVECRADRQVVLDDQFIPTVTRVAAAVPLATFVTEVVGKLHSRGNAYAGRVSATGRGGSAEIADFLMLQVINRFEPVFAHCAESGALHPEEMYRLCIAAAGELATFTAESKRRPVLPPYVHERLRYSFDPVMAVLRKELSTEVEQNAIPIPIESRKFGVRVAIVPDRSLYNSAVFVLAARADLPAEELRRRFPNQLKLGPAEKIRDLVNLQLPGVPVTALPVAPRQIPFHAGFAYFELDQSHELWSQLQTSGGIALFVSGEFPGLALELWAIRG